MTYSHYFARHVGDTMQKNTLIIILKKNINTFNIMLIPLQVKIAFCVYCTGICYSKTAAKHYRLT